MESRALSQDELNLLLNGVAPGQEGTSEPGSGPAVILQANEQKNEGSREEPANLLEPQKMPQEKAWLCNGLMIKKLQCSLFSSCLLTRVIPKRKAGSISWN